SAGERISAHQHDDALRILGKVHRRLTRRVCATHHVDDFALAGQSFRCAATVVNTRTLQLIDSGSVQSPPLYSARDHEGVAGFFTFFSQLDKPIRSFGAPPDRFLGRQNFHSKTLRLHHRAPSQIVTTKSGWKPK